MERRLDRSLLPKLISICIRRVASKLKTANKDYWEELNDLPRNLKDELLLILSKRGQLKDDNIKYLLHNNVVNLDLSESRIESTGLEIVGKTCKNLRKLNLNALKDPRSNISETHLNAIFVNCKGLTVVYLRRCLLSKDCLLKIVQNCPKLVELDLTGVKNTDDDFLNILSENCHYVKSLNLAQTSISDQGIYTISQSHFSNTLQELNVSKCKNLSDESVEAVMMFCKNIRIFIIHGCPLMSENATQALEELWLRDDNNKMKQISWTVN